MATDTTTTSNSAIPLPAFPLTRPTHWLAKAQGDVYAAAIFFACAEHTWLSYFGGRAYLSACATQGIEPDSFGWTAEDVATQRSFPAVRWADPTVRNVLNIFVAAVPAEYVHRGV